VSVTVSDLFSLQHRHRLLRPTSSQLNLEMLDTAVLDRVVNNFLQMHGRDIVRDPAEQVRERSSWSRLTCALGLSYQKGDHNQWAAPTSCGLDRLPRMA